MSKEPEAAAPVFFTPVSGDAILPDGRTKSTFPPVTKFHLCYDF